MKRLAELQLPFLNLIAVANSLLVIPSIPSLRFLSFHKLKVEARNLRLLIPSVHHGRSMAGDRLSITTLSLKFRKVEENSEIRRQVDNLINLSARNDTILK